MVNFPAFFTSAVASCTKLSTTLATDFVQASFLYQSRRDATLWHCGDCLLLHH